MSYLQNKNAKLEKASSIKKAYGLLDDLLKECKTPDDIVGQNGLLKELSKALIERAMQQELTQHLGYERHARSEAQEKSTNSRNGFSQKNVRSSQGELILEVPRDRESSFEPQIIPKNQRYFKGAVLMKRSYQCMLAGCLLVIYESIFLKRFTVYISAQI